MSDILVRARETELLIKRFKHCLIKIIFTFYPIVILPLARFKIDRTILTLEALSINLFVGLKGNKLFYFISGLFYTFFYVYSRVFSSSYF